MHKHFEHQSAIEFADGAQQRWTSFIEETETMVHNSKKAFTKNEPLINYLEAESNHCRIMPQEFSYVTQELQELLDLFKNARTSMS